MVKQVDADIDKPNGLNTPKFDKDKETMKNTPVSDTTKKFK